MKITKRQLRRMINEMRSVPGYPGVQARLDAGDQEGGVVTLAVLEQLTMAHENLLNDIEMLFEEIGLIIDPNVDDLRDEFTELLFPLFRHAEGGSGAPER